MKPPRMSTSFAVLALCMVVAGWVIVAQAAGWRFSIGLLFLFWSNNLAVRFKVERERERESRRASWSSPTSI